MERAGDEPLDNFTVEGWLYEWTATKKAARGQKTGERYERPIKDFLAYLGPRARLPLRAVTPKDVRSFRDAERKLGKSSVTANLASQDRRLGSWGCRKDGIHRNESCFRG